MTQEMDGGDVFIDEIPPGFVQRRFPNAKGPLRRETTPLQRALIGFVLASAYGAFLILLNAGRPRSNWFYPIMAIVASGFSVEAYRQQPRVWPTEPIAGESPRRSMEIAVRNGAIWAVITFAVFTAGLASDWHMNRVSILLGATSVHQEYCRRRGKKISIKVSILVTLIWILGVALYLDITRGLL